jgi:hypothetical protein
VPLKIYDETINHMEESIQKSKLGFKDKNTAIKNLSHAAQMIEESFVPTNSIDKIIEKERADSYKYDGMTIYGKAKKFEGLQLRLF